MMSMSKGASKQKKGGFAMPSMPSMPSFSRSSTTKEQKPQNDNQNAAKVSMPLDQPKSSKGFGSIFGGSFLSKKSANAASSGDQSLKSESRSK